MPDLPVSPLAPAGGFPNLPEIGGVRLATAAAGVKYQGRLDVMLAEIAPGATAAGVFTRSATRSAPVLWCQQALASAGADAGAGFGILVNSGNANAFTGKNGMDGVERTAAAAGAALGLPAGRVFVASTGVIGEPLPSKKITAKTERMAAGLSPAAWPDAARAIMTTDTFPKGASASADIGGTQVRFAGIAKGSGMIAPDMATMLAFAFTDSAISAPLLQAELAAANTDSFNSITVDSDTSTSDTLLLFATGASGMAPIERADDSRLPAFRTALRGLLTKLAHLVVRDGEGATKFVEVRVGGGASDASARRIALAIANSPLVKTAIAGEDPNWGRVVMAVGKAAEPADRDNLSIRFGDVLVAENGWVADSYREADGAAYMKRQDLVIDVNVGVGDGTARVWTCDLTHGYITINADYRS